MHDSIYCVIIIKRFVNLYLHALCTRYPTLKVVKIKVCSGHFIVKNLLIYVGYYLTGSIAGLVVQNFENLSQ